MSHREARIILPRAVPQGTFARNLITEFGGYTRTDGSGFWVDPEDGAVVREPIYVYDIAVERPFGDLVALQEQDQLLQDIAIEAGRVAKQKAVYLRYPDGEVSILQVTPSDAIAAGMKHMGEHPRFWDCTVSCVHPSEVDDQDYDDNGNLRPGVDHNRATIDALSDAATVEAQRLDHLIGELHG